MTIKNIGKKLATYLAYLCGAAGLLLAGFHATMQVLVHSDFPLAPRLSEVAQVEVDHVYYFAYGSNMSSRYLYNIRHVAPKGRAAGRLAGYRFAFGLKGMGKVEPGFAVIVPDANAALEGVVWALSAAEFEQILGSEGSAYSVEDVSVDIGEGQTVVAKTLVGQREVEDHPTSARYLSILLEGARENGLSAEWIEFLAGHESTYVPVASELVGSLIHAVVMSQASPE